MYSIHKKQLLHANMEEVWNFISSPINLEAITPPGMKFEILTELAGQKMYAGQIIEYKISPFAGIKMHWVTEITHVQQHSFFVDEQRFGPYKFWHHQHRVREVSGGIEMEDIVHYKLPLGPLGMLAHELKIKKQLEDIFEYRFHKLNSLFNK
jgi:ligand-binding SRPBCC domain-containing protein